MRIAFLCKRRYTGKDVVADRFGRLHEIPWQLARLGHEVRGFCLDYHQKGSANVSYKVTPGSLSWDAYSLGHALLPGLVSYPWRLLQQLRAYRPDVLLGASDIPHAVLTAWLSRRLGIPYALDLYDNFEGFGQARIPGAVLALRKAVRGAELVIAVSEPLRNWVQAQYGPTGPVLVMPNAIDTTLFKVGSRTAARERLQLPLDAELVGTAGGLYRSKGVADLYAAWAHIAAERPRARLVLAGPVEAGLPLPQQDRVHYLGNLTHVQVADVFAALDVGVVTVADTVFGRYCFPQKAYEMMACDLAVVATDVGVMSALLRETPQLLYRPGDAEGLARAVVQQLEAPVKVFARIKDWHELVAEVEPALLALARRSAVESPQR